MSGHTAQLFDVPGPKARMRQRIAAVIVGLGSIAVIAWVLSKLGEKGNLDPAKWSPFATPVVWQEYLIPGIIGTLQAAAIAVVLAVALGFLLGIGRLSLIRPVRWISSILVEFFRAVPVLVMMIFSFWLYSYNQIVPPQHLALAAVVTGLTFYNGAVIAELIRAGVENLPSGQQEAGLSVGLTPSQTLYSIQIPQAITAMLPALVSQLVVILKDSALGYAITYLELLNKATQIGTAYANVVPALMVVAVLYILMNYVLTWLAALVERRLSRRGRTSAVLVADRLQAQEGQTVGAGSAAD